MSAPTALTKAEQDHVRVALRFLRSRVGSETLVKALHVHKVTVRKAIAGGIAVSESVAVRVAKLAGVGVDDVLTGKYPLPGTCAHCGHRVEDAAKAAE